MIAGPISSRLNEIYRSLTEIIATGEGEFDAKMIDYIGEDPYPARTGRMEACAKGALRELSYLRIDLREMSRLFNPDTTENE